MQWLLSLGPILWNFVELQMEFFYKGSIVVLKGLTSPNAELVDDKEISSISNVGSKRFWLQLMAVETN